MNVVRIHGAMPRPSVELVEAIEQAIGQRIPQAFLASFAHVHGGEPDGNTFAVGATGLDSGVNEFIELGAAREEYEAGGFRELGGFLPIAFAEGGNYVCVKLADPNAGAIYFWDHEVAPPAQGLHPVADSLEAFLNALQPFDPGSVVLREGQVVKAWIDPDFLKDQKK